MTEISILRISSAIALVAFAALLAAANPTVGGDSTAQVSVPRFTVTDIGPLPRVADELSISISDSGQVALWTASGASSVAAESWTPAGARRFDTPAGYLSSIAVAINSRGQAAGWVTTAANPVDSLASVRGVVYTDGTPRVLGTLGGPGSRVFGIGPKGDAVGVSDVAGRQRHAFLERGQDMIDLGTLPGGSFSCAYAINVRGHVVGVSDVGKGVRHAALWSKGSAHDLGLLPNGENSCALAINAHDDIAGYAATGVEIHAVLFKGGKPIDLGDLGDDPSMARGVNDKDDVVGKSSISQTVSHAFFWRDGKMFDLNNLMPGSPRWALRSADAVNNSDQIVCEATNKFGQLHAVRLDPVSGASIVGR